MALGDATPPECRYTFDLVPPPPGANGPKHNRHPAVREVTPYTITHPFIEIDWCWGYLGYVNMLRYRVATPAEVVAEPWHRWTDARNADIVLDERKLARLIHIALQRAQRSTAHRGAGTLSAFTP